jgi:hypothetical protein
VLFGGFKHDLLRLLVFLSCGKVKASVQSKAVVLSMHAMTMLDHALGAARNLDIAVGWFYDIMRPHICFHYEIFPLPRRTPR